MGDQALLFLASRAPVAVHVDSPIVARKLQKTAQCKAREGGLSVILVETLDLESEVTKRCRALCRSFQISRTSFGQAS